MMPSLIFSTAISSQSSLTLPDVGGSLKVADILTRWTECHKATTTQQVLVGEWYLSPKLANQQIPPCPFCAGSKFMQFGDLLKSETVSFKFDLKLQFIDCSAHQLQVLPLQADHGYLGLKSLGKDFLFTLQIFIVFQRTEGTFDTSVKVVTLHFHSKLFLFTKKTCGGVSLEIS